MTPCPAPPSGAPTYRKVAPYLVDCDCHHLWHKIDEIFPYLPRQYVQEIKDFGSMVPNGGWTNMPNSHGYRTDHDVDEHTDFAEFTVKEHLDPYGVRRGDPDGADGVPDGGDDEPGLRGGDLPGA